MLGKREAHFIRSLRKRDARTHHRAFAVEGEKNVAELLSSRLPIHNVYAVESWIAMHETECRKRAMMPVPITADELESISTLTTPNKVLAIAEIPDPGPRLPLANELMLCLALDSIRDPGNAGTILRTADWFGIDSVFCSPDTVDVYNPKVVQSSMGSLLHIRVEYVPIPQLLDEMGPKTETEAYGACLDGEDLYAANLRRRGIVVFGNESWGLSTQVQERLTTKIRIPRFPPNGRSATPESLNVGVAAGIVLAEFRRQERGGQKMVASR